LDRISFRFLVILEKRILAEDFEILRRRERFVVIRLFL